MRILILGGDLAGLLSAHELHRYGAEVTVLVHGQEAPHEPAPPMVFTDPGPWVAHESAWATVDALVRRHGDFRLAPGFLGQLPWLLRWLRHRDGLGASGHSVRALALARQSKLLYDSLHATACLPLAAEPLRQISVYQRDEDAEAHFKRGPVWHMGPSRPSLRPLSTQVDVLPAMDLQWARQQPTLISGGMMVSKPADLIASLRQRLSQLGVRFIHDHSIEAVEHLNQHLHGVTLRGPHQQVEELDTDLVVAASVPAAWPVLKALGVRPSLSLLKTFGLHAQRPDGPSEPLFLHERASGVRLIRHAHRVWAQGPTWLGEPHHQQASAVAHLSGRIAHYFGPADRRAAELPSVQASWGTPDGLPLVQQATTRNLFLNLGHHGATAAMAMGSAVLLQTMVDRALNTPRSTPAPARLTSADGSAAAYRLGQIHA